MTDWRVLLFSAISCLALLAGLLMLAMPDSYEGQTLYEIDATHSVRRLDGLGLGLVVAGVAEAWATGLFWQRRMQQETT